MSRSTSRRPGRPRRPPDQGARRPRPDGAVTSRRAASRRPTKARRPPGRVRALVSRRPLTAGLVVVVALLLAMAWGPLKSFSAAADRVEALEATHDRLEREVEQLAGRRDALQDPEQIELLARRQHGLVKPGEVPFIVVTPEPEPHVGDPAAVRDADSQPWWQELGERLSQLLG